MINDIFVSLKSTPSRLDKISILNQHRDNELLKRVFKLALDPMINFYIKKIPAYTSNGTAQLDWALDQLHYLSNRTFTGHAAIDHLTQTLSMLSEEDAQVIERVIEKDTDCGVQEATVNSVWGSSFIKEFPVMKATPYDEKAMQLIQYPAYSQVKIDGARCQCIIENGKVTMHSSSGRVFELHNVFDSVMLDMYGNDCVIDGELVVLESNGKIMDRKKGNGILNKAVKGTIPLEQAKQVHFIVFDFISAQEWKQHYSPVPYAERFDKLTNLTKDTHLVSLVKTQIVNTEAEAIAHFKKMYASGEEGTILKDARGEWENKRSKYSIKFKGILTTDLKVIRVEEGTGKYAGKIGSLICASGDDLLEVGVGSGLTDADRDQPFEYYLEKIVEVKYNEVIKNKADDSKYALFLPRFVRVRWDKDVADTIDLIKSKGNKQ